MSNDDTLLDFNMDALDQEESIDPLRAIWEAFLTDGSIVLVLDSDANAQAMRRRFSKYKHRHKEDGDDFFGAGWQLEFRLVISQNKEKRLLGIKAQSPSEGNFGYFCEPATDLSWDDLEAM